MPNDTTERLRDENLRDPVVHAKSLFAIENSAGTVADETTRIRELAEDQLELIKDRYADLSSFLTNSSNVDQLPKIARHLRHIKYLLCAVVALFLLALLK